jgi:cell division protein FtsL
MTLDNLKFTARDLILIIGQVITATSFVLIMKGDIRTLIANQQRMETKQDTAEKDQESFRTKTDVELTEMKVRLGILEQKVTDLQIARDAHH